MISNALTNRCAQLTILVLTVGVSASGVFASEADRPVKEPSLVRRKAAQRQSLKTDEFLVSISVHGETVAPDGLPSSASQPAMLESIIRTIPEKAVTKDLAQAAEQFLPEDHYSRMSQIVRMHMRPHSVWSLFQPTVAAPMRPQAYAQESQPVKPAAATVKALQKNLKAPAATADAAVKGLKKGLKNPTETADAAVKSLKKGLKDPAGTIGQSGRFHDWTLAFVLTMFGLAFFSHQAGGKYRVEAEAEDDLAQARGRSCWAIFVVICVILCSLTTFFSVLTTLTTNNKVNIQIEGRPDYVVVPDPKYNGTGHNKGIEVPAGNAGERAFETGFGVTFSALFFGLLILNKRHADNVQISSGLLSFFAFRGATVSTTLSMVVEVVALGGLTLLTGQSGLAPKAGAPMGETLGISAVSMLMVAIAEETTKAVAVIWGMWLSAGTLRLAAPGCTKLCRVLVESPRALMLAGLAAGCGFMGVENMGYLFQASLERSVDAPGYMEKVMRWVVIIIRVCLNIHPWMVGITCGRLARVLFGYGAGCPRTVSMDEHAQARDVSRITLRELTWALYPSVLAHAVFDFSLLSLGAAAIVVPFVWFYYARKFFNNEWDAAAPVAAEAQSSEDTAGAGAH